MKRTKMLLPALLLLALAIRPAAAHNVTVFAWVDDDTVRVESKFSGGRKPTNAPVAVYDAAGNLLLTGATDTEGRFSFTPPRVTDLRVVLTAGMGHKAEWKVSASEFSQTASATPAATAAPKKNADAAPTPTAPVVTGIVDTQRLQAAIEQALDKKLEPLIHLLADSRHPGPSLGDIFGGIGYIFGLVGVAAYVAAKKRTR